MKTTRTYALFTTTVLVVALLFGARAFPAHAQAPAIQKAFEEVKTKLDDLVSAKDENLADDLALRIQAFKKVIEFSLEETKALKAKVLAAEFDGVDQDTLATWKIRVAERFSDAELYYTNTLEEFSTTTAPFDLAALKARAEAFKQWREVSFAPLADDAEALALVAGQRKTLEVAEARLAKIGGDVKKLERAKVKGAEKLSALLPQAAARLRLARDAYENAEHALASRILPPPSDARTGEEEGEKNTGAEAKTLETSAVDIVAPPSIRNEVKTSLEEVKRAYQIFIRMGAEAKKILK